MKLPHCITMRPLRVAVLLGSTRDGPPRPANLGRRVGKFLCGVLNQRGHEVDVVDPVDEALPSLVKPYFAYAPGQAPAKLEKLNERLLAADAYVAVTPEYNHAPSPALLCVFASKWPSTCRGDGTLVGTPSTRRAPQKLSFVHTATRSITSVRA